MRLPSYPVRPASSVPAWPASRSPGWACCPGWAASSHRPGGPASSPARPAHPGTDALQRHRSTPPSPWVVRPAPARPNLLGRGSRLPGRDAPSSIAPGRYCLARLDPQRPWPALHRPGDSARTPCPWPACKASNGQSTSSATSLAGSVQVGLIRSASSFTMLYIGLGTPLAQTDMPSSQSYPQEEDKTDD
jgi:hypothetical protein